MALDWGKEITISGLRKGSSKGKAVYPTKRYMNLLVKDQKTIELRRAIPVALLLIVLVAAFAKFGVYDFYDRVNQKQAELNEQQEVLTALEVQLTDFNNVLAEYEAYESSSLSGAGDSVGVVDALALVDKFIAPVATVASVEVQDGIMSLTLTDVTLDGVGKLVSALDAQPIVENVSVSTAATEKTAASDVVVSMVVKLQGAGEAK